METSDVATQEAPTARGRERREKIVDAASELFVANGFHATSIDEIGAAAGITGPGLYRHFAGKDEILLAALDRMWDRLRDAIEIAGELAPEAAFEALLDTHIALAFEQGQALLLLVREIRHVPEYYRRAAERNEAIYTDAWADVIIRLRPGTDPDDARAAGQAIMGMIGSALRERTGWAIDPEHHQRVLRDMAHTALGAF